MIGGIFLSTKVGGFTKNGVVQCVKLVEEAAKVNSNAFSGTYSSNKITLSNGIEIESVGRNFMTGDIIYFSLHDFADILCNLTLQQNNSVTLNFDAGDTFWNKSGDVTFTEVEFQIYDPMTGEVPSSIKIIKDGTTYTFGNMIQINTTVFGYEGSSVVLTYSERLISPTVRMDKDGTLKCRELVEEPATSNVAGFNGKVVNNTIVLDNRYKIAFTSGSTFSSSVAKSTIPSNVMSVNFYIYNSSQTLSPFGFQLSRVSGTNNFTAGLLNDSVKTNYNYKGPIRFGFYNAYVEETSSGYDYSYFPAGTTWFSLYNSKNELMFYSSVYSREYGEILVSNETFINLVPYEDRFILPTVRVLKDGTIKCAKVQEATLKSKLNEFSGSSTLPPSSGVVTCTNGLKISIGAYSFPGSSSDAYTFVLRDENYRDLLKLIGKGASTTITSALDTSNASLWNQLSDITISEIKLDYLSTTTMPSSLTVTWKSQSYTYSLYPSSTNPYSKLYRPSSSQVVLSVLDRVSFTWTS